MSQVRKIQTSVRKFARESGHRYVTKTGKQKGPVGNKLTRSILAGHIKLARKWGSTKGKSLMNGGDFTAMRTRINNARV